MSCQQLHTSFHVVSFHCIGVQLAACDTPSYMDQRVKFKLFTRLDRPLPFVVKRPVPTDGDCSFIVQFFDCFGDLLFNLNSEDFPHKIFTDGAGFQYLVYYGAALTGEAAYPVALDECQCYYLKIDDYISEPMIASANTANMLFVEIGHDKNFGSFPYETGFKQWFWLDAKLCAPKYDRFENATTDTLGVRKVNYSRVTKRQEIELLNVPLHIQDVFAHISLHKNVRIEWGGRQVVSTPLGSSADIEPEDCLYAKVTLNVPIAATETGGQVSGCEPLLVVTMQEDLNCDGAVEPPDNPDESIGTVTNGARLSGEGGGLTPTVSTDSDYYFLRPNPEVQTWTRTGRKRCSPTQALSKTAARHVWARTGSTICILKNELVLVP